MNGWFNPDNWLDIADHLLLILGVLLTTVVPTWFSTRKTHRDLRLEELSKHVTEIARGFSGLKSELIDEEIRRRESVRELRGDLRDGISHIEGRLTNLEHQIKPNE